MKKDLQAWSRVLHANSGRNLYEIIKVPYKTIAFAFALFVMGVWFLTIGSQEYTLSRSLWASTSANSPPPYESLLLGVLLFIPGVYHVVIALLACLRLEGYHYKDVASMENQEWWEDD